ncbi:MAG TPA: phage holin family protein [Polyangia bacterium]|nr:phage holin family protein [Polyangia bacterium]
MHKGKDESDGIIALVKETADGFGHLIAEHVKLARLELVADARSSARKIAVIALIVPILFVGYALACVGLAMLLGPMIGASNAFFLVGGGQVVLGGLAIAIAVSRLRRVQPLHETVHEVSRSVDAIAAVGAASNGTPLPQLPAEGQ